MATLTIRRATWDGLNPNQRQIMRLMVSRLAFGKPVLYDDAGTEEWVFDDSRIDLDHYAIIGALANELSNLPAGWTPPLDGDGNVDRTAVEADVIARVVPTIVWPDTITYAEDDPNQQQTTLDANSAPAAMRGWGAVPDTWTAAAA